MDAGLRLRTGSCSATLSLAVVLAAVVMAWPAAAEENTSESALEDSGALQAPGRSVPTGFDLSEPAVDAGVRALGYPRVANVFLLGSVDEAWIPKLARYDLLVLNSVWTNDQLARLRALRPDIKLFVYVCPYSVSRTPYSLNGLETDLHDYAAKNELWWFNARQTPASDWPNTWMVNPTDAAAPGPQGPWRTWLVRRLVQHLDTHPELDGVFVDNLWRSIAWAQPWLQLDSDCNPKLRPGGCTGVADAPPQLDAAWYAAMTDFSRRLRTEVDKFSRSHVKTYAVLSNGSSDYFAYLNGTMTENFPRGGARDAWNPYGYNWNHSMFDPNTGYVESMYAARPYHASILNAGWPGTLDAPTRSDDFERHKRLTLASALFGDGFYALDRAPGSHASLWWEPEYDQNGTQPGYLGQPRGAAFRVLVPSGSEMVPGGDFGPGIVSPWFFQADGSDASAAMDLTQYVQAPPSACVTVRRSAGPTSVKLYAAPLHLDMGQAYSLRFWARSSVAQEIVVHLYAETCPSNRCMDDVHFRLGRAWRQYEYSFVSAGNGAAGLNIFMGTVGQAWFDDVSLRPGDTSLFRRNFDRGVVLVNYTNVPQTVALGESMRRLAVPGNPAYDGALVSTETIPPSDARILLRVPYSQRAPKSQPQAIVTGLLAANPNPFNPSTRIAFGLAHPGRVRLCIYDVSGRLVRTLLDEVRPAGSQDVTWDGTNALGHPLSSGAYFCTFDAGATHSKLKLVLLQ